VSEFDVLRVSDGGMPVGSRDGFHWVERLTTSTDPEAPHWSIRDTAAAGTATSEADLSATAEARRVTLSVEVARLDPGGRIARLERWDELGMHTDHARALTRVFGASLDSPLDEPTIPLIIGAEPPQMTAAEIAAALLNAVPERTPPRELFAPASFSLLLSNGSDGNLPGAERYAGDATDPLAKTGLEALTDRQDISTVAAPGYSAGGNAGPARDRMMAITRALIAHCERMHYRIAVLDSADGQTGDDVRAVRAQIESSYAALYYPWVHVTDGMNREINLPPSGFIAGIYARNDIEQGVHKAPANVVQGAIGLEIMLSRVQQDVLGGEQINVLRWFEQRGYRVWGVRTVSSDPEWTYVNVRRYVAYLEQSIDVGTHWVVFEPNGAALWVNVRRTVEDFLYKEWIAGRLLGERPEQAFSVRCDRSTMTQNDLDNGQLICIVGVALTRPAEFAVFRLARWTADRRP
jgi:hypothetical protein